MGDFMAEITAQLDLGNAKSQLDSFVNQKRNIKVDVDLKTGNVNIGKFLNQIQSQFQNAGQQSGQNFSRSFSSAVGDINIKNAASQIANMQRTLAGLHFDHSSIDAITQNLQNMDVAIKKVTTNLATNGNVKIKVDGIDELGRAVSVVKEFSQDSGVLARSNQTISQSFDDMAKVSAKANEYAQKLQEFKNKYQELLNVGTNNSLRDLFNSIDFSNISSQQALDDMIQKFNQLEAAGAKLNASMTKSWAGSAVEKLSSNVKDMGNEIDILEKKFAQLGKGNDSALKQQFVDIRQEMDNIAKADSPEQMIASYNKVKQSLKDLKNSYRDVQLEQKNAFLNTNASILGNQITAWMNNNTKAARAYSVELQNLQNQLKNVSSNADLAAVKKSFQEIKSLAAAEGNLGKGVLGTLFSNMTKLSPLFGMGSMISVSSRAIRSMWSSVVDLDTALVDLQKTTSMTNSQLESFYKDSNSVAKQMGVSTEEIINQAAAWSRLGYSSKSDATEMAKLSSQFAAISPGMDVDKATDGLVSVMKAYGIETNDVLDGIMSKINVIGNTAATSNSEIVDMLTRSSSAMAEGNNTLEETIALETAAVEITRDAASVGTAYKTVAMRIRGYDEETEQYIGNVEELSGKIADLTKTASTPGGISLFTDASKTEYKSTYQLLDEISQIYDQLSDKNQAELLEALAGKRQGQIVAATIRNFDAARKAMDDMANSAGSADKEMEIIQGSLEYKINALKETGVGVAQNLFQREDMKTLVEGLTGVLSVVEALTDKLGLLGTIAVGVGIKELVSNFAMLKNIGTTMSAFGGFQQTLTMLSLLGKSNFGGLTALTSVMNVFKSMEEVTAGTAALKSVTVLMKTFDGSAASINAMAAALKGLHLDSASAILGMTTLSEEQMRLVLTAAGVPPAMAAETAATIAAGSAAEGASAGFATLGTTIAGVAKGIASFLLTNPVGWAIMAGAAVLSLNAIYDNHIDKLKEASEAADELAESSKQAYEEEVDKSGNLQNLVDQYKELKKQYEASGETDAGLRSQILDVQNQINDAVGVQAGNLDLVNGKLEDELGKLQDISAEQAKREKEAANTAYKNAKDAANEAFGLGIDPGFGYSGTFDYVGKITEEEKKALKDSGFDPDALFNHFGPFSGEVGLTFIDGFGKAISEFTGIDISTAEGKVEFINGMMESLEESVEDYADSDLYTGLQTARDHYQEYVTGVSDSLDNLIDATVKQQQYSDAINASIVKDGDTLELYRKQMVRLVEKDPLIKSRMENGEITKEMIDKQVDDWIASYQGFSDFYIDWLNEFDDETVKRNDTVKNAFKNADDAKELTAWYDELPEGDKQLVYSFVVNNSEEAKTEAKETLEKLSKDGNVDLNVRPTIDTSVLKDAGWKDAGEGVATVFTSTFANEAAENFKSDGIAMNFTPIVTDDKGNFVEVLSPKALENYATGVINGTHDDYLKLKIGATFEGSDAISQATKTAETIHENQEKVFVNSDLAKMSVGDWGVVLEGMKEDSVNVQEAITTSLKGTLEDFNTIMGDDSEFKSSLDSHVESLNTLKEAIDKYKSGELEQSDIVALKSQFAELSKYSKDELGKGLTDVYNGILDVNQASDDGSTLMGLFNEEIELLSDSSPETAEALRGLKDEYLELYNLDTEVVDPFEQMRESLAQTSSLSTAMSEMSSQGYLNESTVTNLIKANEGYKSVLQQTASGLQIDTQEAVKLANAQNELNLELANANKISAEMSYQSNYEEMVRLAGGAEQLKQILDSGVGDSRIFELNDINTDLSDDIAQWESLSAEIRGAISLLTQYKEAQSSPNASDNYSTVVSGKENADKLYEQGWTTKDDFTSYAMLLAENGATMEEAVANYEQNSERFSRYLTEDTSGLYNFLDDAVAKSQELGNEFITIGEDGKYAFNITDMNAFADSMNMNTEMAENFLLALKDAGFDVDLSMIGDSFRESVESIDASSADAEQSVQHVIDRMGELSAAGVDVSGSVESISSLLSEMSANGIDVSGYIEALNAIGEIQGFHIDPVTFEVTTEVDTTEVDSAKESAQEPVTQTVTQEVVTADGETTAPDEQTATVTYKTDTHEPEEYTPENKEAKVIYVKDSSEVENYQPPHKNANVVYAPDVSALPTVFTPITRYVNYVKTGDVGVDGTAHANGTAFANGNIQGSWGTKKGGIALGGELGEELLVRDGRFTTIGRNSAELFAYKKNDIIFNAEQTKQILEKGKITHGARRGKAFVDGTAFYNSTATGTQTDLSKRPGSTSSSTSTTSSSKTSNTSSKTSSSKKSSSKDDTSSKIKDFSTWLSSLFDWAEVRLKRLNRLTDKWTEKAENAVRYSYNSITDDKKIDQQYVDKEKYTKKAIDATTNEIIGNESAIDTYTDQLAAIAKKGKLDSSTIDKIINETINGTFDLETYKGSGKKKKSNKQLEAIKAYQSYYEKVLDCQDAVEKLTESQKDLYKQLYNIPIEQANAKIEKYTKNLNVLEAISSAVSGGSALYLNQTVADAEANVKNAKTTQSNNDEEVAEADAEVDSASSKVESLKNKIKKTKNKKKKKKLKQQLTSAQADLDDAKEAASEARSRASYSSSNLSRAQAAYNDAVAAKQRFAGQPDYMYQNYLLDQQTEQMKNKSIANQTAIQETNANYAQAQAQATAASNAVGKKSNSILSKFGKNLSSSQKQALQSGGKVKVTGKAKKNKKLAKQLKNYNKAVANSSDASDAVAAAEEAAAEASQNAAQSQAEYIEAIQKNAKQKFDNVKSYYDSEQGIMNANIQRLGNRQALYNATGVSQIGQEQKDLINSEIGQNNSLLANQEKQLAEMKKAFEENKANMSKADMEAAQAEMIALEGAIDQTKTTLAGLNDELANIEVTRLSIEIGKLQTAQDKLNDSLDLKKTKGIEATASDYQSLIDNSKSQVSLLQQQNDEYRKQQQGLDVNSQKYLDLQSKIDANDASIREAAKSQEEWNNEIANLPYQTIEKYIKLLDAIAENRSSQLDIKEEKGIMLDIVDYSNQIVDNNTKIAQLEKERAQAWQDYQKALQSPDGVYGGKTADEWRTLYYNLDTDVNTLIKDNVTLNNTIANLPYEKVERYKELLESIASYHESGLDIKETMGIALTKNDYMTQIEDNNERIVELRKQSSQALADYYKALNNPDGVYGGKTANEWYSIYLGYETDINNTKNSTEELKNAIANIPYEKIEKIKEVLEAVSSNRTSQIALKTAQGLDLSESDYMNQMADNNNQIAQLQKERLQAFTDYQKALSNPDGVYGGKTADQWRTEYLNYDTDINNLRQDNEKLKDSMRDDIYWRTFERAHDSAQRLREVISGISSLIDDDMLYDTEGKLTNFGKSKVATLVKDFETARTEVGNYSNDIANLNNLYEKGYYTEEEYKEKLGELQKSLLNSASNMKSNISSIIDMYKKLGQAELDSLNELIDKRNKALQAKKDYYDYDKTLKNKNKELQILKAQRDALEGISTIEARGKRAQLDAQISDAQEELNETIQNHQFDLSSDALSDLSETLKKSFDERWKNIHQDINGIQELLANANSLISTNAANISNAVGSLLKFYGINYSTGVTPGVVTGHASGVKHITKAEVAQIAERGNEIFSKNGNIYTSFSEGDFVIPHNLSENLFKWGELTPESYYDNIISGLKPMTNNSENVINNNQHYDSLLTIEGDVTKEVFPGVKQMCIDAYQYFIREATLDAKRAGIKIR